MSKAFPDKSVTAGMEARVAPDAPVNTNPAAPDRAMEERGSPKIGVLSACCSMLLLRMRLTQTLRRPIMMIRLPS